MSEQPPNDSVQLQQPSESQQPEDDELAFPKLKPGDAWGESVTKHRANELEEILQQWEAQTEHGGESGPFDAVTLTGAEVFWLAARALAGRSDEQVVVTQAANLTSRYRGGFSALHLEGASLIEAHLEGASLERARLEGAFLLAAHLEGASLDRAHLEGASLVAAHLEGASLERAHLEGAFLQLAFLDSGTALNDVLLGDGKSGYASIADARWGDANLAVVDWTRTKRGFLRIRQRIEAIELGDEHEARKSKESDGKPKSKATSLYGFKNAVRANRQLATVLRQQGLNEDADRFAYKAQKLQREVLRRQRRYGAAFGSWLIDIVAGHGYKPMRTLTVYLLAMTQQAML